ncbi:MAG: flavin reductase family protein [Erysipelotrichaceae bacterium]|nr:flavin reductase family protein [Erysipelotrichaceae bacterium]
MAFKTIEPMDFDIRIHHAFAKETALLTAGNKHSYNMMTIAWGTLGFMWNKPIVEVVVRPSRYTKEFIDTNDIFSLSFFGNSKKRELALLGSKSGRDFDKMHESGLTPFFMDNGGIGYDESRLIIVAKKLYTSQFRKQNFTSADIPETCYGDDDFHYRYIGEVIGIYDANLK